MFVRDTHTNLSEMVDDVFTEFLTGVRPSKIARGGIVALINKKLTRMKDSIIFQPTTIKSPD